MTGPAASVIVRVRDEAGTIERTLRSIRRQTVPVDLVLVDSGSRDGSLELARPFCDTVLQIPPEDFTYGRALNMGAAAASAPIHFALSAHCAAPRNWVELALELHERADVAATNGALRLPDGRLLTGAFHQNLDDALRSGPWWGFSNHASSWRASVWSAHPFDEEMAYAEDKEWARRVLEAGYLIAYHPDLWVDMSHAWSSAREFYRRERLAAQALAGLGWLPGYGARDLLDDWWHGYSRDDRSKSFHRANPKRMVALLGRLSGVRSASASARSRGR